MFKNNDKNFCLLFFIIFFLFFLYEFLKNQYFNFYLLALGIIFFIFSFLELTFISYLRNKWISLGLFLGKIISPIVLYTIYFTVVFFTKIFTSLFGIDNLKLKKNGDTFWLKKKDVISSMNDQF